MMKKILLSLLLVLGCVSLRAQNASEPSATAAQLTQAKYYLIPLSATVAAGSQATLTIPAPAPGLYNYICTLHYNASQNGTSTVQTNAVTTSTNFNSYAIKYSLAATANISYDWVETYGTPGAGCVKSASPATATTFVGPAAGTNLAQTWTSAYYQAP